MPPRRRLEPFKLLFWGLVALSGIIVAHIIVIVIAAVIGSASARERDCCGIARPLPQIKERGAQCAAGYRDSGGYCAPTSDNVRRAIPKQPGQQCPSGWAQSGGMCQEIR